MVDFSSFKELTQPPPPTPRHKEIDEMSSNATENVQTKTGSVGGYWEEERRQMGGNVGRQKWGLRVAEGGLWVIQMRKVDEDGLECSDRQAQMVKRRMSMSSEDPTGQRGPFLRGDVPSTAPSMDFVGFFFPPLLNRVTSSQGL